MAWLVLLSTLVACGGGADERPRNALLVTLDTTVPEALSCYGRAQGTTPALDRLAAEAVRYTNARTVTPITAPAHASMLTGLYPLRHGVRMNGSMMLPAGASTLAERARERGFETAAFVAAVVLRRDFGLDQGFERYDDGAELGLGDRRAEEISDRVLDWLDRRDAARPFFLWAHYFDPHQPHVAGEPWLSRAGGNPYLAEVAYMDEHVGRVLERLRADGLLDETLVVVVADHGEGLGRHGELTHAAMAYDSTLHVPLLVRHPDGWGAGTTSDAVTSVVDVFATVAEALDLGAPGDVDGESLFRRDVAAGRGVYFESYFGFLSFGWSPLTGWVDARGKYVHASREEFFDVASDAGEHEDLSASAPGLARYRDAVRTVAARERLGFSALGGDRTALLEQIEKLGYAGVGSETFRLPEPLEDSDRPSPHDRGQVYRDYLRALSLIKNGDYPAAEELLRAVLATDPRNHTAWDKLGNLLMRVERWDEAIECFDAALAQRADEWVTPWLRIAACHAAAGRAPEAIAAYRKGFARGVGPDADRARFVALLRSAGAADEADRVAAGGAP